MTEEDQKLVALAALHGARFERVNAYSSQMMWSCKHVKVGMLSIGRAAVKYLHGEGLMTEEDMLEYLRRTMCFDVQDVDEAFIKSVLHEA